MTMANNQQLYPGRRLKRLAALSMVFIVFAAIIIIDIRPTAWLKLTFFRYYYLEQLNHFTSMLNPLFIPLFPKKSEILTINIQIDPEDVEAMVDALPLPYPAVFLDNEAAVKVPARVTFDGKDYQATVRIRGKSPRHWQDEQKSLRVDILGANPPRGMKIWHLVIPYDRYYVDEDYSSLIAQKLGLPVWHEEPAWVTVNGVGGVYLALEPVDDVMLKNNGLQPGIIYTETELGSNPSFPFLMGGVESWRATGTEKGQLLEFSSIERLLKLTNTADDETFYREIPTLVDIDLFLRWQAHAVLISSDHQDDRHNAQIYLNPVSGKLNFFLADPGFYNYGSEQDLKQRLLKGAYNAVAKRVLTNPVWYKRRNEIIREFLNTSKSEVFLQMQSARDKLLPWLMRDNIKLHSNLRALWLIYDRERFFVRHWELLSRVMKEE